MTTALDRGVGGRVLGVEVAEGPRGALRETKALFFSVLFPVGFFALFASLFGNQPTAMGLPVAASMLATYATYGVVSVMLMNPASARPRTAPSAGCTSRRSRAPRSARRSPPR